MTFFSTHFHVLPTTLSTHRGLVSMHLAVQSTGGDEFNAVFQYKVVQGPVPASHYGKSQADLADDRS